MDRSVGFALLLATLRAERVPEDAIVALLIERFGSMTQDEVGAALGMSRARVGQIEEAALLKMRRNRKLREWSQI